MSCSQSTLNTSTGLYAQADTRQFLSYFSQIYSYLLRCWSPNIIYAIRWSILSPLTGHSYYVLFANVFKLRYNNFCALRCTTIYYHLVNEIDLLPLALILCIMDITYSKCTVSIVRAKSSQIAWLNVFLQI